MWTLVSCGGQKSPNSPEIIRLLCGKEYVVGRKNCDLLLSEDPSISRKHAILTVKFSEADVTNTDILPQLTITDYSKFGTLIDGNKMNGSTATLTNGQLVKFGQVNNVYRVSYDGLILATSSLPSADKSTLNKCLARLGGHQVNDWNDECTHLVMGKVSVTVKAICALASLKPIVSVDYFAHTVEAVDKQIKLPSVEGYIPSIMENGEKKDILKPQQERRSLFENKSFFFCSKSQYQRMESAIRLAGGSPMLLEKKPRSLSVLTTHDSILMYCDPKSQPIWYKDCVAYLVRKGKRYIQDAEIGHAILHCSTTDHCNPDKDAGARLHEEFSQRLLNTQTQNTFNQTVNSSSFMAPETQKAEAASIIAPETQGSTRRGAADRSSFISDILPSPTINTVKETQHTGTRITTNTPSLIQKDSHSTVKPEPLSSVTTPQVKRKLTDTEPTTPDSKRVKESRNGTGSLKPAHSSLIDDLLAASPRSKRKASQLTASASTQLQHTQITVCDEGNSTLPSMRDLTTPPSSPVSTAATTSMHKAQSSSTRQAPDQDKRTKQSECKINCSMQQDVSVVQETQSSTSNTSLARVEEKREVTTPPVIVKTEPVADRIAAVESQPVISDLTHLSEERQVEIGDGWNNIQVDYADLFRKTRPNPTSCALEERNGMALWKGKWVPNFKRFRKCGKKDSNRLPIIIGGGDFINALASQTMNEFVTMPDDDVQERATTSNAFGPSEPLPNGTSSNRPTSRVIQSSVFGGQWELP